MKRTHTIGICLLSTLALTATACQQQGTSPQEPAGETAMEGAPGDGMVPVYEFDPSWPKIPLPDHWAIGNVVGVDIDEDDNVWIVHRPRTLLSGHEDDAAYEVAQSECCVPAPAVIEFDQAGNVVQAWGGPPASAYRKSGVGGGFEIQESRLPYKTPTDYTWPESEHTIAIDPDGNVWIGNNGGSHILKLTKEGKFLMQIGEVGVNEDSSYTKALKRPAGVVVDPEANELYVADGYGNRRVIVFDTTTGEYKRHWGAYGNTPDDSIPFKYVPGGEPSQQFNTVHCVRFDQDGLLYVCDRANSRIQVFQKDGTFVKEAWVAPETLRGSVLDIAFSRDPDQTYLFVPDGRNEKVWILTRKDLKVIGSFGSSGHFGGQFTIAHNIAVDSRGNLYVTESLTGQRVQRFNLKGYRPVAEMPTN